VDDKVEHSHGCSIAALSLGPQTHNITSSRKAMLSRMLGAAQIHSWLG